MINDFYYKLKHYKSAGFDAYGKAITSAPVEVMGRISDTKSTEKDENGKLLTYDAIGSLEVGVDISIGDKIEDESGKFIVNKVKKIRGRQQVHHIYLELTRTDG